RQDLISAYYLVWLDVWASTVILSGLGGNLWYLLNPWAAICDAVSRLVRIRPALRLPNVGVWPAVFLYLAFACLELTSGMSNQPWFVAIAVLAYTFLTLAVMLLFGRDEWRGHCEAFTVLFDISGRFCCVEAERHASGRIV